MVKKVSEQNIRKNTELIRLYTPTSDMGGLLSGHINNKEDIGGRLSAHIVK
jgi:hypothetical protein